MAGRDDQDKDRAQERTVAMDVSQMIADEEAEGAERTVAMDVSQMRFDDEDEAPSGGDRTVAMDVSQLPFELDDAEDDELLEPAVGPDRTVAMRVPPEMDELVGGPTFEQPPKRKDTTVIGHPGIAVPPAERDDVDGHGPTLQAPVVTPAAAAAAAARRPTPPAGTPAAPSQAGLQRRPVAAAPPTPGPAPAPGAPAMTRPAPTGRGPAPARKGPPVALLAAGGVGLLAVIGVVLWLVLRGGAGGAAGDALSSLPKDVDMAGAFDAARLRGTWLYEDNAEMLKGVLEQDRDYGKTRDELGVDVESLDRVAFGGRFVAGEEPRFALLARGAFDPARIEPTLKKELARGSDDNVHQIEGHTFYGRKNRAVAGFAGEGLLLGGQAPMVASVLKTRDGGSSLADNDRLREAMKAVDSGAVAWAVVELTGDMLKAAGEQAAMVSKYVQPGDRFGVSVDLDGDLTLRVAAIFGDEARATTAKTDLEGVMALGKMALAGGGAQIPEGYRDDVKALADGLKVEQDGETLSLAIVVPKGLLERAVADAKKAMPAGGAAPAAAPDEEPDEE